MTQPVTQSPESYTLRAATADDTHAIRDLIHSVRINPFGLDWHRFVVATAVEGDVIGCGQIKLHGDGTQELASIAVKRGWRRHGVARALILRLMSSRSGPVYLTCRARLGVFYAKFGFQRVEQGDMPPYYRTIQRITGLLSVLGLLSEDLWVMRADC